MNQPRQPKDTPRGGLSARHEHAVSLTDQTAFCWPATEHREVAWTTNPDQYGLDGRRPNYEDRMLTSISAEVPPMLADLRVTIPPELAEECRETEAEITRLDARSGPDLAGLTSFLIRSESVASSRIERVYADADDLARASIDEEATEAARTTAAASAAMSTLIQSHAPGEPIAEESLLAGHHELLKNDRLNAHYAGRYRDVQNWIGGSDFSPRDAIHVPPPWTEVQPLMTDLVAFTNRSDMAPLAQAALAHGQFEAIHPFVDGNGRIGRGLIAMSLRRRSVARQIVVPVAATMLADVDTYFDALIAYRNGDAEQLVSYMNSAALTATREAGVSADRLAAMPQQWRDLVKPRYGSSADRLIDHLVANPTLNAAIARDLAGASAPRTYEALEKMTQAEVLREITGGTKGRIWVASDVISEIADLDERIGKRAKPSKRWL